MKILVPFFSITMLVARAAATRRIGQALGRLRARSAGSHTRAWCMRPRPRLRPRTRAPSPGWGGLVPLMGLVAVACGADVTDSTTTTSTTSSSVPLEAVECSSSHEVWEGSAEEGDPAIAERFVGSNGEFVDTCEANGDLVQYTCEWVDCSNEWDWCAYYTGNVSSRVVDCAAACVAGACQ